MICTTIGLALAAQATARTASPALTQPPPASPQAVASPALGGGPNVVPPGESYVLFDAKGAKLAEYGPGQTPVLQNASGQLNCVMIKCPKSFKKGTRCWRCGED